MLMARYDTDSEHLNIIRNVKGRHRWLVNITFTARTDDKTIVETRKLRFPANNQTCTLMDGLEHLIQHINEGYEGMENADHIKGEFTVFKI